MPDPSGEITIILGLLKENRDDTKEILKQLGQHNQRLSDGDRDIVDLKARVAKVETRCKIQHNEPITDYPPQPIAPAQRRAAPAEATTRKIVKFDPGVWIKVGLFVGGVLAALFAVSKGVAP